MTKDEKIAKLGKEITDRATVLLGKDKITPDTPEYLGINSALKFTAVKYDEKMADDILDIALTMKKRVPLTIEQLAKKNPQFDRAYLEKAMQELQAHEGNVWTIIYSLRREDAARLGYDNAESWRLALLAHQNDFAEAMQILPEHLHWYAAFHDEGEHPHIHMMLWSDDPRYGFLRKDRLLHMQSVLTNTIYADELKEIYIQKDVTYKEVTEAAREIMREIVDRMESTAEPPASIQQKLLELATELHTVSGKKQYGYLKKPLKDMVDSIVDELEKNCKEEMIFAHPEEIQKEYSMPSAFSAWKVK